MNSILITGCNRGLGLGLVRRLVKEENPPKNIIVTCRDSEKAKELQEIKTSNDNVHILELDVRNTDTFEAFASKVGGILRDEGLNVLFNNAGYAPKSTRINMVKSSQLLETFQVNTIGPIMLTKALLPLLKHAAQKNKDSSLSSSRAAVINMSSTLGSISANTDGGYHPYRCSKAALNMATKSLSIDLNNDGILVTSLHPGWVKTNMGGPHAPLSVEDSVEGIVNVIENLSAEHNGGFYQWDGKRLEW